VRGLHLFAGDSLGWAYFLWSDYPANCCE